MRLLYIKFLFLVGIFGLFLAGCTSETYAAIGNVSGEVIVKPTGAGVANIWVEWRSPVTSTVVHTDSYGGIDTVNGMPGEGEVGIRYVKTDSSGKFLFPHWAFGVAYAVRGGTQNDKGGVSYPILDSRARQYLTWIKPLEPEVPPDTTAVAMYDRILDETNYDYDADVNSSDGGTCCPGYKSAVAQASKYRPAGTGWVRMANRTDINGGFQCNAPPTISAIKPDNFKGFFDNNDQQLHNWGNGYTPIVLSEPIEFNPTGPIDLNPSPSPIATSPNQSTPIQSGLTPPGGTTPTSISPPTTNTPASTTSPKVDIWAESGVVVTGKGSGGGTMRVDPGQPFTLFWTATNASTCVASGSWAGIKQASTTSLSKVVSDPKASKTYNYTLTCFNNDSGIQESDSVIIQVNSTRAAPFIQTREGDVHSNEGINVPGGTNP